MTKRRFLAAAAASTFLLGACIAEAETAKAAAGELSASVPKAQAAGAAGTGLRRLRRQGALLYVPSGYRAGRAAPLLVTAGPTGFFRSTAPAERSSPS